MYYIESVKRTMKYPYTIFPLGDSALLLDFNSNIQIDLNEHIIGLFNYLSDLHLPGILDIVPTYTSIAVHYDVVTIRDYSNGSSAYAMVAKMIHSGIHHHLHFPATVKRVVQVPVCYDALFAPDLQDIAKEKNLSVDELVQIHCSKKYHVFMIGFLPGFAYMGETDTRIRVARKVRPRALVEAGSVGVAGLQTGIYPLSSPGGWQIIGRTPMKIFDKNAAVPILFHPGDSVQFFPISKDEFTDY